MNIERYIVSDGDQLFRFGRSAIVVSVLFLSACTSFSGEQDESGVSNEVDSPDAEIEVEIVEFDSTDAVLQTENSLANDEHGAQQAMEQAAEAEEAARQEAARIRERELEKQRALEREELARVEEERQARAAEQARQAASRRRAEAARVEREEEAARELVRQQALIDELEAEIEQTDSLTQGLDGVNSVLREAVEGAENFNIALGSEQSKYAQIDTVTGETTQSLDKERLEALREEKERLEAEVAALLSEIE